MASLRCCFRPSKYLRNANTHLPTVSLWNINSISVIDRSRNNARTAKNSIKREIHTSDQASAMFRETKRRAKAKRKERAALESKLERLDVEDRPTGCLLCPMRTDVQLDYKNVRLLSQFISPHTGRIYGSYLTGLCKAKQEELRIAIERARKIGYMSNTMKHLEFHNDPKLF